VDYNKRIKQGEKEVNAEIIWIQEKAGCKFIRDIVLQKIRRVQGKQLASSTGLINCFNCHWLTYFKLIYDSWDRWIEDTELAGQ
jgi:hypothetical protein